MIQNRLIKKILLLILNPITKARIFIKNNKLETVSSLLLAGGLIYLSMFILQASSGITKTVESNVEFVRLQIVSTIEVGQGGEAKELVQNFCNESFNISIVSLSRVPHRSVPETIIISRDNNKELAVQLAGNLGINNDRIIDKELTDNRDQVNLTLVLGEDWYTIKEKIVKNKESDKAN